MSLRVPTLVKDSLSDVGQLITRDWIRVMMTFFALHWMFVYIIIKYSYYYKLISIISNITYIISFINQLRLLITYKIENVC